MAAEERIEFKTEIQELLHLIIHTLYTHKEIFLRELISNAVDALSKVQFESLTNADVYDKDQPLEIQITLDKDKKFLTIEDTGIGMTKDQLVQQIGTIAHSGTKRFAEQLKQSKNEKNPDMIGQFGVGFYSVFMVSDYVTLETRSMDKDAEAVRWESDGQGSYTLSGSSRRKRGTSITLKLKDDMTEFLEEFRVRNLVEKYSNFLPFPIMLGDQRLNQPEALWHMRKSDVTEDQYKAFYKQIAFDFQDPLHWEHLNSDAPVQFDAIIFFPQKPPFDFSASQDKPHGLKLYTKRVFIQDDCKELVPPFLRFLKGVVDTEDIPLNVSRETIQNDVNIQKINKIVTKKVIDSLKKMAKNDAETYPKFWGHYGKFIKEGVHSEYSLRDKLLPLMRFHSTKEDGLCSLAGYLERKQEDQKSIYYAYGEDLAALKRSPHLEFFKKHDLEVLLVTDPMDDFVLSNLDDYKEMKWVNVESSDLNLSDKLQEETKQETDDDQLKKLAEKVQLVLQDQVQSVEFSPVLVDSPCRFTNKDGGVSQSVKKLMMQADGGAAFKRDLQLNPNHEFIQGLAQNLESNSFEDDAKLLFHLACLLGGEIEHPRELADIILKKI